ncbi:MAG: hypothetical protein U1E40_06120 [Amaricoccus sp.]
MRPDREPDFAPGLEQLLGDLRPEAPAPTTSTPPGGSWPGLHGAPSAAALTPAVSGTIRGNTGRWNRPVAATTCPGLDNSRGRFDAEAGPALEQVTSVTSTPQRIGASIRSASTTK